MSYRQLPAHWVNNPPPWQVGFGLPEPAPASSRQAKPRHRPPDEIPRETIQQLMLELEQRKAKGGRGEYAQEKIGLRLGLSRPRVKQALDLQKVGWGLLRSHPEFSAKDGFVCWPSVQEAARLLASESAEN